MTDGLYYFIFVFFGLWCITVVFVFPFYCFYREELILRRTEEGNTTDILNNLAYGFLIVWRVIAVFHFQHDLLYFIFMYVLVISRGKLLILSLFARLYCFPRKHTSLDRVFSSFKLGRRSLTTNNQTLIDETLPGGEVYRGLRKERNNKKGILIWV